MTSGVSPTPGDDGPRVGSDDPAPSPSLNSRSGSREQRMRAMVAELDELAARAREHVAVMRAGVQESINWSNPADVHWARGALDDAIVSAAEAERDFKRARALVEELFPGGSA